jgi:hypothetical protein
VTVRRGALPVRIVRLRARPFTDRLVAKFGLPVAGWRGQADARHAMAAAGQREEGTRGDA